MANNKLTEIIEDTSNPFTDGPEGEADEDAETDALLRELFEDGDEDDDGGFDQPLTDEPQELRETVSQEDAVSLVDEAKTKAPKDAASAEIKGDLKAATKADDKADDEADDKADDKAATKDEADLTAAELPALLEGVPDDRQKEVSRRLEESKAVLEPFQRDYVKRQMEQLGISPAQVATRLVDLAEYAERNPGGYLAWAAQEMAAQGASAQDVLQAAAAKLNLKVVAAEASDVEQGGEDDDLFADPEILELRKQVADLKKRLEPGQAQAGQPAPDYGPDSPEATRIREVQQQVQGVASEVDEAGNPVRPHFDRLRPRIAEIAQAHVSKTGQPATADDLKAFYSQAEREFREAFGVPAGSSAAQGSGSVSNAIEKKAAAAQKAKRASKTVDGAGQGASRRPAVPDDADLETTLRLVAGL